MMRITSASAAALGFALLLMAGCESTSTDDGFMSSSGTPSEQPEQHARPAGMRAEAQTTQTLELRQDMRKLWTDHVVWTRQYIVAAVDDRPDKDAAAKRLLKNQEDIGAAIAPFYGQENAAKLTELLKEHITIAVDLVEAAKAADDARFQEINANWQRNGDEIADFLSAANSHWPQATLREMMAMHLSTTIDLAQARLEKNWERDVQAFDAVYDHILQMADALSEGIIAQFPERFEGRMSS